MYFDNFNEYKQLNILFKFNSFASKDEHDIILQNLNEKHDKQTHIPRKEIPKSRQCRFKYFVQKNGGRINVCKQAYISLFGVPPGQVRRLCERLLKGCTPTDKRGTNEKVNVIEPEVYKAVHDHIQSFPKKNTHYGGHQIQQLDSR